MLCSLQALYPVLSKTNVANQREIIMHQYTAPLGPYFFFAAYHLVFILVLLRQSYVANKL